MKNLQAHKQIVALHRARNRCNVAMFAELQRRMSPLIAASQERWDGMLLDLRFAKHRLFQDMQVATLQQNLKLSGNMITIPIETNG